jgi:glyceraldehyde-3-phosphate dehydrogenase/erythrose-4-phosphate dehydrogenase
MAIRIGIKGLGRIGRQVSCAICELYDNGVDLFQYVAVKRQTEPAGALKQEA